MEEREDHIDCGDTKGRLYTRKVNGGYVQYCHNCNFKTFIRDLNTSPTETVKNVMHTIITPDSKEDYVHAIRLPVDYKTISDNDLSAIPKEGLAWLYKYNITREEIIKYGIGYSERYKRLILPVFKEEELIYWQGRNLKKPTKEHPKYLNIRQSGAKSVFFKCKSLVLSRSLVVVEDILSAIRCSHQCDSLALLGSYFPLEILKEFSPYERVYIYLDSDKYKESIKASIKFHQLTGKEFKVIYQDKDPKDLTDEQLNKLIGE